ncbi:hypothetical protein BWQ93_01500 [Sphingopyxis sp. QXT-31]|uniref:hypothetical protein n=1 Tax=Sphingopyxis sp. QXT-31 TaxID=1357916 RepID=UPI00097923D1|nr:hypothetical protein [Sphingopyxis sp. QXT-31]APZ97313.1 hypothetical protein BWQ93_01500 [Sphingopyxis sp. QXT-31]
MDMLRISMVLAAICLAAGLYAAFRTIQGPERGQRLGWGPATIALFGGAGAILLQPVQTHAVKIDLPVAGH